MAMCRLRPLSMFIFLMVFTLQTHLNLSGEVHDVIEKHGLPRGLIPNIVKSYTLSEDGNFRIFLEHPCYVQFDKLVYYDSVIRGKLKSGSATDVSGIHAKMLFMWLPVTGIDADIESDMVEFYVGFLSKSLPAKQFQEIPACRNRLYTDPDSTLPESM